MPANSALARARIPSTFERLDVDGRAVAPAGKKTVLVLAHVGDLYRQPDACDRQRDGERQGCKVDDHAVAVIVVLLCAAFVLCEAFNRRGEWRVPPPRLYRRGGV